MKTGRVVRVLLVDDSAVQLDLLHQTLEQDPQLKVVGVAHSGPEALKLLPELRPDVVAIDLNMPGMDGFQVSERIMQDFPTPILLLTMSAEQAVLSHDAHRSGAITLMLKPQASDPSAIQNLQQTLKTVASIKMVRRHAFKPSHNKTATRSPYQLVVVAASTGGPPVLQTLLSRLPAAFPIPILIVQHIAPGFEPSLQNWLQNTSPLPIHLAREGMEATRGVYLGQSGSHLEVQKAQQKILLHLSQKDAVRGHRPSADVLFQSAVKAFGHQLIGIQLTGMGDDGASGLKAIRDAGGLTLVQSEQSSAVFGMPQSAIRMGAAQHVLDPEDIPLKVMEALGIHGQ